MPIEITDEMVEAVWRHNCGTALITQQMPFAQIDDVWRKQIRDVLAAALAAAPVAGVDAPEPAGDAEGKEK